MALKTLIWTKSSPLTSFSTHPTIGSLLCCCDLWKCKIQTSSLELNPGLFYRARVLLSELLPDFPLLSEDPCSSRRITPVPLSVCYAIDKQAVHCRTARALYLLFRMILSSLFKRFPSYLHNWFLVFFCWWCFEEL